MKVLAPTAQRLRYADRHVAGRVLAEHLAHYRNRPNSVVLALPRGGVPVAFEVAGALQLPLDVLVVRKLGYPGHAEFAMGAVASGRQRWRARGQRSALCRRAGARSSTRRSCGT